MNKTSKEKRIQTYEIINSDFSEEIEPNNHKKLSTRAILCLITAVFALGFAYQYFFNQNDKKLGIKIVENPDLGYRIVRKIYRSEKERYYT